MLTYLLNYVMTYKLLGAHDYKARLHRGPNTAIISKVLYQFYILFPIFILVGHSTYVFNSRTINTFGKRRISEAVGYNILSTISFIIQRLPRILFINNLNYG